MNELKKGIQNFPFWDLHRFGILKTELNEMLMATGKETSDFMPFNLLVFNEYEPWKQSQGTSPRGRSTSGECQ